MRLRKRKWMDVILQEDNRFVFSLDELEDTLKSLKKEKKVLEIGSGKGGFLFAMANKYNDIDFLGVEMQKTALAIALKNFQDSEIDNIRFLSLDVQKIFDSIEDNYFDVIFLNFSDPWPKKKQHKRRLTYPTFLKEYCRILKDNGKLIFKTDNENLFIDSLKYLESSEFIVDSVNNDYDGNDEFDAQTEYETKFRSQGIPIHRFIVHKGE